MPVEPALEGQEKSGGTSADQREDDEDHADVLDGAGADAGHHESEHHEHRTPDQRRVERSLAERPAAGAAGPAPDRRGKSGRTCAHRLTVPRSQRQRLASVAPAASGD